MRARRAAVCAVALAGAVMLLASCGIPVSASPNLLSKSNLPQALVQKPPSPPGNPDLNGKGRQITIYLIQASSGDLVRVRRSVAPPVTVQKVLNELEAGPVVTEFRAGDGSALAIGSDLQWEPPIRHHVATIRLDSYFSHLTGNAPVEELGQIVWSVLQSTPRITKINFVGPGPIPIEISNGVVVNRPVTECDYLLGIAKTNC